MTDFLLEAQLIEGEKVVDSVNLYIDSSEPDKLTITSKSKFNLILFNPDKEYLLQYQLDNKNFIRKVIFNELKFIDSKPYYEFNVIKSKENKVLEKKIMAFLTNKNHEKDKSKLVYITEFRNNGIIIESQKPLNGREIDLQYRWNNHSEAFNGKIIWKETKNKNHYYELFSS